MSKSLRIATPLSAAALLLAVPSPSFAGPGDPWILGPEHELLTPDPIAQDRSGEAVATDGDWVVVGAAHHDHGSFVEHGAVYVYRRTAGGLVLDAELLPGVPANNQSFGNSVDVHGDTIVVGAEGDDGICPGSNFCESGAVYVFVHNGATWSLQAKLTPSGLEGADRFGSAVRIQGDTLVAGSIGDRDAGSGTGSAYVFTRAGTAWSETQKLLASDLAERSAFGASLALHGDLLIVGAPLDDQGSGWTADYGASYVFRHSAGGWVEETKLRPNDPFVGMEVGRSVSVQGDLVLCGAPGANAPLTGSGAAYVFEWTGAVWTQRQKLVDPGAGQQDHFGISTSMLGDSLVVGSAPDLSGTGSVAGFRRTSSGWERFLTLEGSDSDPFDRFGVSVRLSSEQLVVGARGHTHPGGAVDAGAAYAFDVQSVFEPYCDALPNSTGQPASLTASGSSSLSANDLVLTTTALPASMTVLLIYGSGQTQLPLGDGLLCVSGFLRIQPAGTSDASGTFARAIDYAALPLQGPVTAGSTWNFQAWFRDTTPVGFNLSNALQVTFVD